MRSAVLVIRVVVGALLLPTCSRAQRDSARDVPLRTASLLTGDRSVGELGADVTVLDVDALLREAPVRTLTELLMGRVPGLEVLPSSGTVGTGSRILMRGLSSFTTTSAPQIYVDGIRVDDDVATLTVPVGGQTTSRVDDIEVERIATIAILRGPAAAALYGTDAANGVLVITTKRGIAGRPRLHAFSSQGFVAQPVDFPSNFRASDSSGAACTAVGVASGACRLSTSNVLDSPVSSPFRNGYLRQYGLSGTGGSATARYWLAGEWDGLGGVYGLPDAERARLETTGGLRDEVANPNYLRRSDVHGSAQLLAGDHAELTATAAYYASGLRLPQNDRSDFGILSSGLLGGDSAHSGWRDFLPGEIFQLTTAQDVEQSTGSLAGRWRPTRILELGAVLGFNHTYQHDGQVQRPGEGPNGDPAFSHVELGRSHDTRYTGTVTATAIFAPSQTLALRTSVGMQYFKHNLNLFDSSATFFGSAFDISETSLRNTTSTLGLLLQQQLDWRERLFVTGMVRRDKTTLLSASDPATVYPSLEVAWRGPTPSDSFFLSAWRLRAAYGAAGRQAVIAGHRPERSREFEAGVDADLISGRLTFDGTVYDKRTTDLLQVIPLVPSAGGGFLVSDSGAISNRGIELAVAATLVRGSNVSWTVAIAAWGNRNRVLKTGGPPLIFGGGTGVFQVAQAGLPLGSYWGLPITHAGDANGDGLVTASEVQLGSQPVFLGAPFPTQGGSLSSTMSLGPRVRLAGLFEYRGGSSQLNETEAFRCLAGSCRAASDPSTPVADQVAWAAAQAGTDAGWVQPARFLKLRVVSLTFVAPANWAARVGGSQMTFTLAGRNLLSWTSYRGLDPELNAYGPEGPVVADFFTQPQPRYWTGRLDITF